MKIYISGRISGNEEIYKTDFDWLEEQLSGLPDVEVLNPIKYDNEVEEKEWLEFIKKDISLLKDCDAIIMIRGDRPLHKSTNWRKSYGAQIERIVAKKYGLKIFYGWKHFQRWYQKEHKYDINSEAK